MALRFLLPLLATLVAVARSQRFSIGPREFFVVHGFPFYPQTLGERCARDNLLPASITDQALNNGLTQNISAVFRAPVEVAIGLYSVGSQFYWMDGNPFAYSNVVETPPPYAGYNYYALIANSPDPRLAGKWSRVQTGTYLYGLCEKPG